MARHSIRPAHSTPYGHRNRPVGLYYMGTAMAVMAASMAQAQPYSAAPSPASTLSGNAPMTMADAVRTAVATHPGVRGAGEQVQQASATIDAARAGYKPQINGGLENQVHRHRNSSYDSRYVYTATVNGSQMVYDFGKVKGAVERAEYGVRASEEQLLLTTNDISLSTAQAWVDAHLYERLVTIAREQMGAIQSITDLVTERAAKGATSRSDVEQAHSRINALRAQLLNAEADALRARLALMHLTGRTSPVAIAGDMPAFLNASACDGGDIMETPAVRLASARRDEARADLDIAKAQQLPTVSLDGNAGYALTKGSRLYGEYRTTGQIGFNVSMPLYQGGRAQAQTRGALHQLRMQEDAVAQARLETQQGLADARANLDGWAQRTPVLQNRVSSIDATRELYRLQYLQLGTRSLLDLLNAEQEYYGARVEQIQGDHMQYRLAIQCLYFNDRLNDSFGIDDVISPVGPMMAGE